MSSLRELRAVNNKAGNKFPSLNLPSIPTTPIPTFPLKGKEMFDGAFERASPSPRANGERVGVRGSRPSKQTLGGILAATAAVATAPTFAAAPAGIMAE